MHQFGYPLSAQGKEAKELDTTSSTPVCVKLDDCSNFLKLWKQDAASDYCECRALSRQPPVSSSPSLKWERPVLLYVDHVVLGEEFNSVIGLQESLNDEAVTGCKILQILITQFLTLGFEVKLQMSFSQLASRAVVPSLPSKSYARLP